MEQLSNTIIRGVQREQEMKFGTQITDRGVRFRLWVPNAGSVSLKIEGEERTHPMQALPRGWFEAEVDGAKAGTLYRFVMEDGSMAPDPASRFQPYDVDGPSEVIDPRDFAWGTSAGAASHGKKSSSMSFTSAPSPPKEAFSRPSISSTIWSNSASLPSSSCRSPTSKAGGTGDTMAHSYSRRTHPMVGQKTSRRLSMQRTPAS